MNLGIIADGNRRWAKSKNLSVDKGHKKGFDVITEEVLEACIENKNCTSLTVYGFSTENWKRSPLEIANLMKIYLEMCSTWEVLFQKNPIKLVWCGRRDRLNVLLKNKLEKIEAETKHVKNFTLYLCLDYGGHDEIERAVIAAQNAGDATRFMDFLEVPALDIVVRTGGEKRLSNFCMWQSAYAELFFIDKFLPELLKSDIEKIFFNFEERDRRKGK